MYEHEDKPKIIGKNDPRSPSRFYMMKEVMLDTFLPFYLKRVINLGSVEGVICHLYPLIYIIFY